MPLIRRKNGKIKKSAIVKLRTSLDQYVEALVFSLPEWINKLFEDEKVFLIVEDDNSLCLGVAKGFDSEIASHIQHAVCEYLELNPVEFIVSKAIVQ